MQFKPRKQTLIMVHMLARHLLYLRALLKLILTNGTLIELRVQQLIVHGDIGEILDGGFGGGGCAVAIGVVLGELLDELLEAGAEEVVAEVGGVVEVELDVGAVGVEVAEVVLEEVDGVEGVGVEGGVAAGGGGEEEGEEGEVVEAEGGGGVGVGVRVRVLGKLFEEALEAEGAEGVGGVGGGDFDAAIAFVAEEGLCSALLLGGAGERHVMFGRESERGVTSVQPGQEASSNMR